MKVHILAKGIYFEYYGVALKRYFEELGHDVIFVPDDKWEVDYVDADCHILVSPNVYTKDDVVKLPGYKVGVLTEQLPHLHTNISPFVEERWQQFQSFMSYYDLFVEWSYPCFEFIKQMYPGVKVLHFPHGYIKEAELEPCVDDLCDWDILFLGDITRSPRRHALMNFLCYSGLKVYPRCEGIWGEDKKFAISKSRIILNIHFAESPQSFEVPRIFEAAHFGKPVLSESMNSIYSSVISGGFDFPYSQIPQALHDWIVDPELRKRRAEILRYDAKQYPISNLVLQILRYIGVEAWKNEKK